MSRQDAAFDIDPEREPVRTVTYWFVTGWFDGRPRVHAVGPYDDDDEYLAKAEARRMREEPNAVRVTVVRQRHAQDDGRMIEQTIMDDWVA